MTDEQKRRLIRSLSKADLLQSKSSRGGTGWRPTELVYDNPDPADELAKLTGRELNRELKRQILSTIPVLLILIVCLGFVLAILFAH